MYPIPANATRIRYLESTGTQYVDTDFIPTLNSSMMVDFSKFNQTASWTGIAFCGTSYNSLDAFGISCRTSDYKAASYFGNKNNITLGYVYDSNRYRVFIDKNNFSITDMSTGSSTSNTIGATSFDSAPTRKLWLLNGNTTTADLQVHASFRLYGCKIYDNGSLVRDYIPIRVGSTGELFDRVSGICATRVGTFVCGPDTFRQGVVPTRMMPMGVHDALPYTREIEYLESTGTQYVDTGIAPGANFGFSISFSVAARPSATSALFGARTSSNVGANAYCAMMRSTGDIRLDTTSSAQYSAAFSGGDSILYAYTKSATVVNGTSYTNGTRNTISRNFYLFAINNNGTAMFGSITQRYVAAKIYDGSTLIRSYVPVRKGATGYLYDRVSKQLFGNAGTGAFVLGPDK